MDSILHGFVRLLSYSSWFCLASTTHLIQIQSGTEHRISFSLLNSYAPINVKPHPPVQNSYFSRTINDWNSLPVDLVEVADADIFRTGLQSLL